MTMSNDEWERIVTRDARAIARLGTPETDPLLRAEMDRRALIEEVRHLQRRLHQMPEVTLHAERGYSTRCEVRTQDGRLLFTGTDDSERVLDGRLHDVTIHQHFRPGTESNARAVGIETPLALREGDSPEQVNAANERIRRACEGLEA